MLEGFGMVREVLEGSAGFARFCEALDGFEKLRDALGGFGIFCNVLEALTALSCFGRLWLWKALALGSF